MLETGLLNFFSFFFLSSSEKKKYLNDVAQSAHREAAWLTFGKLVSRRAIFSFSSFLANISFCSLEDIVDLFVHWQCSAPLQQGSGRIRLLFSTLVT